MTTPASPWRIRIVGSGLLYVEDGEGQWVAMLNGSHPNIAGNAGAIAALPDLLIERDKLRGDMKDYKRCLNELVLFIEEMNREVLNGKV